MAFAVLLAIFAVVLFTFVLSSVKIIRPYQRGLVERLGKYHATVEPGLRMIYPVVDRMVRVDMRETVVDVPPQEVITSDNVVVTVDAVVYYEATDPRRLIYNVSSFIAAVVKLAQTNLRNVIGDMELDQALTSSEMINTRLRDILDDATDKWGTRVVRVEIQRIEPPADVVESMHHQMRAERTRRAVVTEAEGNRQAAITNAEGEKAAAVLQAEALKQSAILEAEGRATAIESVAKAEAAAIERVYGAIHNGNPTPDLIAIKYLEALQHVANGRATKVFLPTEATALLGALGGMKEMLEQAGGSGGDNGRRRTVRARPSGS
jgi:regulator of protease activity HflC (stomatin/prohibitin superfamily)